MSFNSPFTRYLDTNYVPNSDEIQTIKELINDHETALHYLQRGKSSCRDGTRSFFHMASVAYGREAIRSHQDFIRLHSSLLIPAPARAAPLDVLATIFTFSLDMYEESRRSTAFKKVNPRHPIVTITHVCHEWRELAVGIPSLWRHIHIDFFPRPSYNVHPIYSIRQISSLQRSMDLITERVTIFLSRATPLPIVLSCIGADPHPPGDLDFNRGVTSLINVLRTAKWEDVSFRIDIKTRTSPFFRFLPIPADSVATIRVLDLGCCATQLLESRLRCERLTHLSMGPDRKHLDDDTPSGLVAHEALTILRGFPNLQNCTIRFSAPFNGDSSQPPLRPVTLPFLSSLSLSDTPPHALFGSNLIAPSLRRLFAKYFYPLREQPHPWGGAEALLIREYRFQLTEVTLGYGHITMSALTQCLKDLENVTSLTLSPAQTDPDNSVARLVRAYRWNPTSSFLDRVLLDRLTPKPQSNNASLPEPCLCPNLESLSYEFGAESNTLYAWVGLIAARRSSLRGEKVAYLQKLTLSAPPRLDLEVILGQLEARGIDVEGVRVIISRD